MKKIRNFFVLVAVALMSTVAFTSCGDDDDDANIDVDTLVGTWDSTYSKGWEKENGVTVESWDEPYTQIREVINADGTLIQYYRSGTNWYVEDRGTYVVRGNQLLVTSTQDGDTYAITVEGLSAQSLILSQSYREVEDGVTYTGYDQLTFTRVR